jgi:hypothetical protein
MPTLTLGDRTGECLQGWREFFNPPARPCPSSLYGTVTRQL